MNDAPINQEIVYSARTGQLILIPKARALELAGIHHALKIAQTWGEFKSLIPAHIYEEVVEMMRDDFDEGEEIVEPAPESPFAPEAVPGYGDGDFPGWPAQEMLDWMPEDIQEQFGEVRTSVLSGDFLEIAPAHEREVVAALEARGYHCVADVALIEKTYGG